MDGKRCVPVFAGAFVLLLLFSSTTALAIPLFFNEIHYDNQGGDTGEGIEIAGTAGTDLNGWEIYLYNGNNGLYYDQIALTGEIPDLGSGWGVIYQAISMQNGAPDGMALVDPAGFVVQLLSYEGLLTANDGPASGQTSIDIGITEGNATATGTSLQLIGSGDSYGAFSWRSGQATFGDVNTDQQFGGGQTQQLPLPSTLLLMAPLLLWQGRRQRVLCTAQSAGSGRGLDASSTAT